MDFSVNGNNYISSALDAKRQFHLARRLGPILSGIQGRPENEMFPAIMEAVAAMSDEQCDYVLDTCMSVVKRQQDGNTWAPVYNDRAHRMQFDDIDMGAMLQIARHVIQENLASFFGGNLGLDGLSPKATA
ncbi:phage tail assembly chaperone [Dyella mobilis]|uniref:Bacteriophage protein n=1 Tax=Dyella mobilis TaxID=1849582 RepID=A0ABS2KK60_9GAMM|nr:hypothetical protein [Dyella mobilis]MBM7131552.1 hypothetical protein [Dyella mobilis]GLQ96477.1 hypothetical protein GCM10007863_08950 [Dyella mobilis]